MDLYLTLCQMLEKHGPAGDEGAICAYLSQEAKQYCDEITVDVMGNLIAHKKGPGKKILFSAHMDSIGLMATHFEDSGFIRVGALGGINPSVLLGSIFRFQNGVYAVVAKEENTALGKLGLEHLYLDIGATSKEEAESMITPGDTAVLAVAPTKLGGKESCVVAPYLDNRVSCAVMLAAMERLAGEHTENDLYFVFSAQEEVGLRGATTAAYALAPDYGIALDVAGVGDALESNRNATGKLGGGAGIKIMDRSIICHPEVVSTLEELAKAQNINVQRDVLKAGGTDAGAISRTRGGVKTGGISVPCRYVHSPGEMVNLADVEACIQLTVAFAQAKL